MHLSPRVLVAGAAIAALTVAATPGGAATAKAPRWNPPVLVSATESARETSLVIDPTDNRRQFACAPSGVPATGPMFGVFLRSSPTAPDIWSAFGGVSPGSTPPPRLPRPAVTAGSGSPLSLVVERSS